MPKPIFCHAEIIAEDGEGNVLGRVQRLKNSDVYVCMTFHTDGPRVGRIKNQTYRATPHSGKAWLREQLREAAHA
jgi:hypothetical protein